MGPTWQEVTLAGLNIAQTVLLAYLVSWQAIRRGGPPPNE